MITFDVQSTINQAFRHSREKYLTLWIQAYKCEMPENIDLWARRLEELNDAQITIEKLEHPWMIFDSQEKKFLRTEKPYQDFKKANKRCETLNQSYGAVRYVAIIA